MSFVADLAALVAASVDHRHCCPKGWSRVALGSVAKIINGFPFKSNGFGATGHPVIRIRDVARGRTETYFSGDAPVDFWVERGELIVGMDGDFQSAIWRSDRAFLNQRVCKIVPDETRLDRRYLAYLLPGYLELINKNTPSVTVKHLSSRTLELIPLPLPTLDRQRRIVSRIDELFSEIDNGEAALARARADLATWRKALLKAAVTGELTADWRAANPPAETGVDLLTAILAERRARWEAELRNRGKRYQEPPEPLVEDLPSLADGWVWASLAQVAFISGGLTIDAKRKPIDPIELPYLRVANVQRGNLDLKNLKTAVVDRSMVAGLLLKAGDILLNEGGDRDKIGRGWVYEEQIPVCLHQNHVFKARPASGVVSPYLMSMYFNELGRRFFIDQGKQTTNLASISLSKVSTAPVPIPPALEAAEILRLYSRQSMPEMDEKLDDIGSAPVTLRQSILAAAFRGELV